ncbi:Leucine aminopeptidase 1 [Ceratobasidium sp. 423]|nr:Leucine aminopeptidase 1 [Ceratobasidium sp. 423]
MAPKSKSSAAGVKHKFIVDYSRPAGDGVFDPAAFEDYLRGRIKLEGKTGQLGDKIKLTRDSKKLTVTSTVPLSKRYIKYLTQKYLKKNSLRDWIRVVATSKDGYELRFYKIDGLESSIQIPNGFNIDLESKRLVQFNDEEEPVLISELEKIIAKAAGRKFFDITDQPESAFAPVRVFKHSYGSPNATELVKPVLKTLSTEGPKANLEKFSSFRTRYYRSETGKQSQQWLKAKIAETTDKFASSNLKTLISISEFPHSWGQNSIILRIKGSDPNAGTVIISAHQDSTNMWPFLPAPGADDDGSGTVTILEAYRALIAANFTPVHDVELHWYSAEEGGLLGSQAVAKHYHEHGANIKAQIQFDMTAWVQRGSREEVGIITDFVDPDLTAYVTKLVETYLSIPPAHTKCGYACSDHASWTKYGYPSAFSIESSFETTNHNIHSANDRIDFSPEFSFDHALEFSKLAVAFAVELGGWHK